MPDPDSFVKWTFVESSDCDWKVIVFAALAPVIAGILICSVKVPSTALNTTVPETPWEVRESTASLKVSKLGNPPPDGSIV